MDPNWPHRLPLDRRLLGTVFQCDNESLCHEYLQKFQSMVSERKWEEVVGSLIFHVCVDIFLEECTDGLRILYRIFGVVSPRTLDLRWLSAAFACICRSRVVFSSDFIDSFSQLFGPDPVGSFPWPCVCSSGCDAARRSCENISFVDLSLRALNYVALERILSQRNSSASPSGHASLFSVFSCSMRDWCDAQRRTLEVLHAFFPPDSCPEFYAAANLIAILTDAGNDNLPSLPVEQIGALGRACKSLLPTSLGSTLLLLAAKIPMKVSGRDAIFRFFLDLKINVSESNFLLFSVLRDNPDFWTPQTKLVSPATMLFAPVTCPKFYYLCAHLKVARCHCSLCRAWSKDQLHHLFAWLETMPDWTERLRGYTFLIRKTDFFKSSIWSEITDCFGNTVLHLFDSDQIVRELVWDKKLLLARNYAGLTALDVAVRDKAVSKINLLAAAGAASCDVLRNGTTPAPPVWEKELERLTSELSHKNNEMTFKIGAVLDSQKRKNIDLTTLHRNEIAKHEQTSLTVNAKLAKTEALLNESLRERSDMELKLKRVEKNRSKLDKVRKEFESENEGRECSLCMERAWDTALPCGHCYCQQCVGSVCAASCPTCARKTGGKSTKLFVHKK